MISYLPSHVENFLDVIFKIENVQNSYRNKNVEQRIKDKLSMHCSFKEKDVTFRILLKPEYVAIFSDIQTYLGAFFQTWNFHMENLKCHSF